MPFQFNYNQGYIDRDGEQYTLNIQPVIPISLGADWNVISRTILPIVNQEVRARDGQYRASGWRYVRHPADVRKGDRTMP